MKLLLYCTKAKPFLYGMYSGFETRYGYHTTNDKNVFNAHNVLNGKIVAECDYEVEKIFEDNLEDARDGYLEHFYTLESYDDFDEGQKVLLKESCLQKHELSNYLGFENGYAIHIKNLHIFDEPKELNKCMSIKTFENEFVIKTLSPEMISKAPQNMMKVKMWVDGKEYGMWKNYILISIRPEHLVNILNGEKKIEIRKKVLKEMLKNE